MKLGLSIEDVDEKKWVKLQYGKVLRTNLKNILSSMGWNIPLLANMSEPAIELNIYL